MSSLLVTQLKSSKLCNGHLELTVSTGGRVQLQHMYQAEVHRLQLLQKRLQRRQKQRHPPSQAMVQELK